MTFLKITKKTSAWFRSKLKGDRKKIFMATRERKELLLDKIKQLEDLEQKLKDLNN